MTVFFAKLGNAGAKTIDGLSMFVNQALAQFKLFTGQEAEAELMRGVISKLISSF